MRRKLALGSVFATALAAALAAVAAAAPSLTEFPLPTPNRDPLGIARGPEGNVWFTENANPGAIGRITPEGTITEFTTGLTANSQPTGITAGPDGNLWFTENANPGAIGRITPTGTITEFTTGLSANSQPTGITAGPDGNLWFTENANPGAIGRITPTGTITEFTAGLSANSQPTGITAGPDGNLWFTEKANPGRIGRITPGGTITEFTTGLSANSQPTGITAGPDGNLWFTESAGAGRIGRITVGGAITQFTSGLTANSQPEGITAGSEGSLYFTEYKGAGRIARITTAGAISESATTTAGSQPQGIATGGDGNVWFAEGAGKGQIGRLSVPPAVEATSASATERTAVLKALVGPNSQATSYSFEYGESTSYDEQTSSTSAGSGASLTPVSAAVTELEPGHTYHYRAVARNPSGTSYGPDETFTTADPPQAQTNAATAVSLTGATLNGSVDPEGQPTTYWFEWGTTKSYGQEVPVPAAEAGSEESSQHFDQALEGLTPDTKYHYRIVASNCGGCEEGTTYGADQVFTTAAPPSASTGAAIEVSGTSATLTAQANPGEVAGSARFEWGPTAGYGTRTTRVELPAGSGAHELSQTINGLEPGHTYHFRAWASDCEGCASGTTLGADATFTTPAPAEPPAEASPGTTPTQLTTLTAPLSAPSSPPAPPAIGSTALVHVSGGTVQMRTSAGLAPMPSDGDVPMGAVIMAEHGQIELTVALDASGRTQSAALWGGSFTVSQAAGGMTTFTLAGPRPSCGSHAASASVARARQSGHTTTLWAHDNHGQFSTRGHNSVATVRGTVWGTSETCHGTLTTVDEGLVSVKPKHGRRVLVRAGHSYLARR